MPPLHNPQGWGTRPDCQTYYRNLSFVSAGDRADFSFAAVKSLDMVSQTLLP